MIHAAKIKIAVIGTGYIGPRHAKSINACDEAELLCLVDPAPAAGQVAQGLKVPLCKSAQDMLQKGYKPDAAIVCTPNHTHVPVATELLATGIHVLVEKPIATTIEDGKRLLKAASASDKQLLVGHHRRFNPYITATKQALSAGAIGRPIAVSGIWALCKPSSYFEAPTEWRAKAEGGGTVLINLIHEVDILQYLFGPITKVHAEQTLSQRCHQAEEGAGILFRFTSGVVGTFVLSDATPSSHNWESATGENPTIPHTGNDCYRIFGTEGTLSVGDMRLSKHAAGEEKGWANRLQKSILRVDETVPFDDQVRHFVRVCKGYEEPRCSGKDGLSALVVCDAVKRAIADGCGVEIAI